MVIKWLEGGYSPDSLKTLYAMSVLLCVINRFSHYCASLVERKQDATFGPVSSAKWAMSAHSDSLPFLLQLCMRLACWNKNTACPRENSFEH